jgi:hypothetical protein
MVLDVLKAFANEFLFKIIPSSSINLTGITK